ncbi:tetrahydrodipicolinate N-succinyltransferase [Candidatus Carsonella ruddii CS isolate Thao2000]|uniref:Tetrahydrodipicolinate N-succinyltransferase n=1 Tax=Candidatus Carsonella ruddii CS isolate Thao2000 TaxID=1202537 RepID=J7GW78_CARRU|nr:DapH/DapD/GlmU-related protein [Candidatus Carsonella ruddii]AFP83681.1 tetrahydrodipicolinate N-succinyltransferase [Candidatus Carsonella ruddii CS isolate Thao2000]
MYVTINNYTTNLNKKIFETEFIFIKKINFIFLKIKKIKKNFFINIKQIINFIIFFNIWKKIIFKNNLICFFYIKNIIMNNIDFFFKLNLISKGLEFINKINLTNLFNIAKTILWTNIGFFEIDDFFIFIKKYNILIKNIIIESIDKIPYLTKYIIPNKVRISNSNRIRLGSFISEKVTIMSEGYLNFNTFISKNCMIEGRVSAGVYIGKNTDLGGSCSIMGTLSGGGNIIISIGENCLIGANAGVGISLGDNNIIESGLYITNGIKVFLNINFKKIIIKAKKLSFINNLTFYRNSLNGKIYCCKNNIFTSKTNNNLHIN